MVIPVTEHTQVTQVSPAATSHTVNIGPCDLLAGLLYLLPVYLLFFKTLAVSMEITLASHMLPPMIDLNEPMATCLRGHRKQTVTGYMLNHHRWWNIFLTAESSGFVQTGFKEATKLLISQ